MKALLQRVRSASVAVADETVGAIETGVLVLLGVERGDSESQADWIADKTVALRIFADDDKAMNRSVLDVGGSVLLVSQFTLAADTTRGNRPGFSPAAEPDAARRLYERVAARIATSVPVATGRFGADMQVSLVNDGPVTFLLER